MVFDKLLAALAFMSWQRRKKARRRRANLHQIRSQAPDNYVSPPDPAKALILDMIDVVTPIFPRHKHQHKKRNRTL